MVVLVCEYPTEGREEKKTTLGRVWQRTLIAMGGMYDIGERENTGGKEKGLLVHRDSGGEEWLVGKMARIKKRI